MDALPILVPVVAGIVLCPAIILCGCLRRLNRRMDALEGVVQAGAQTSTGFIGGIPYGGSATAPPLPTAPIAPGPGYPYFTQMPPPPPPQLHPLPYALQQQPPQRRVV
jgi:hypothetical protein